MDIFYIGIIGPMYALNIRALIQLVSSLSYLKYTEQILWALLRQTVLDFFWYLQPLSFIRIGVLGFWGDRKSVV